MGEFFGRLTDSDGFVPRRLCGEWTDGLVLLHTGSDLFIWLAYLSIPLVLGFFATRGRVPFHGLFWLFGAFILACGFTHFFEVVMFYSPMYRLSGLVKLVTALVSWATVIALLSAVPRAMAWLEERSAEPRQAVAPAAVGAGLREYAWAVGLSAVVVGLRYALTPWLENKHPFHLLLIAVVAAAWRSGFGPAVVATVATALAAMLLFLPPRWQLAVADDSDRIGLGLYVLSGFAIGLLGEGQISSRRRALAALRATEQRERQLAAEVDRRLDAEDELRKATARTAEALNLIEACVANAPVGLAFFDRDLRFVRVNDYLAAGNGLPVAEHIGRTLGEVLPNFPADAVADIKDVLATGTPVLNRLVTGGHSGSDGAVWQSNYYPVRRGRRGGHRRRRRYPGDHAAAAGRGAPQGERRTLPVARRRHAADRLDGPARRPRRLVQRALVRVHRPPPRRKW